VGISAILSYCYPHFWCHDPGQDFNCDSIWWVYCHSLSSLDKLRRNLPLVVANNIWQPSDFWSLVEGLHTRGRRSIFNAISRKLSTSTSILIQPLVYQIQRLFLETTRLLTETFRRLKKVDFNSWEPKISVSVAAYIIKTNGSLCTVWPVLPREVQEPLKESRVKILKAFWRWILQKSHNFPASAWSRP